MGKINNFFSKIAFSIRKHSPEILTVAGIVGVVSSAVIACIETTKIDDILEEHNSQIDTIKKLKESDKDIYVDTDYRKDILRTYVNTSFELVKLYSPALILGGLSIGGLLAGHNTLKKRNVALSAAYVIADTGFKKYRRNVVERFGKNVDDELRYGLTKDIVKETKVDESGKKKTVKEESNSIKDYSYFNPEGYSSYCRIFDCGNPQWDPDPEVTMFYLLKTQSTFNNLLRTKKYVFLNEVYKALGFPETKAGQVVGWRYKGDGDNFIDFGIYNINHIPARDFVNGNENVIILDFNVDGNIWEDNPFVDSYGTYGIGG